MPNYRLNLSINSVDIKTIYDAQEKIVILKKTSSGFPIAWVTFLPFEGNYVSWEENYSLYASNTEIQAGATIVKLSEVAATPKQLYKFNKGTFDLPETFPGAEEGQYIASNKMNSFNSLVFGLAQKVEFNGNSIPGSPINASIVPLNQIVKFTPYEQIVVFLQSRVTTGSVITEIDSQPLEITFGGSITTIDVVYDSSIGGFKQA
ncbi:MULTISPECIES: hypothetical protein [Clostridium]|uniref:Uncharacterized protein n=1 Tax=Clostridium cibarium TaxID=2762247 RepID=A0ABR8PVJ8_9CLOT|nr:MULTISPECIES: hypothetical protein [Clostridium]MBD7912206.1 hypothetical protein [Clostridium cibarium]